jgi:hypothetical protein
VVNSSAIISECLRYRYRLSRWWGDGQRVAWLMMNPSTADALKDDATIRKCCGFAQRWGFDGIEVVNLFAWRDRDPSALLAENRDLRGPEYEYHLHEALAGCSELVAAWGCESTLKKSYRLRLQAAKTQEFIRLEFPTLSIHCLGKSKFGTPYHPLMLAYSTERQPMTSPDSQL